MAHRNVIVALRHNGVEVARILSRVEVWRRGDLNRTLDENFNPIIEEIIRTAGEAGEAVGDLAVRLSLQEEDDGSDPFPMYFHFDPPVEAADETEYRGGTYEMDDGNTVEIRRWDGQLISRERVSVQPIEPPVDPRFNYYASDPAQYPHGSDGGTPMTLAELIGADEEMDRIDGILDGGLGGTA